MGEGWFSAFRISRPASRPTAFVSIMKGCNCACSYCIVPSVRGREVCRNPDEIIGEINTLVATGTKEVTLLGQNVNAYRFPGLGFRVSGFENHQVITFATLLQKISQETEVLRIRFTSPHPRDVSDDLIRQYAENEKLMPHIHLPVQAGSNKVLRMMRRGYTRERYIEICNALRRARPGISITTDIIAGFPGEGEFEFGETIDLMQQVEFDSCFAFKYSLRPGTEAAEKFEDDVPMAEKEERLDRVLALQRKASLKKNKDLINIVSLALVTGLDKMKSGLITGRLPDNRIVNFAGHPSLIGNIVPMRITQAHPNSLAGEMIADS